MKVKSGFVNVVCGISTRLADYPGSIFVKSNSAICFDKVTGEERWRGGHRSIGYSSPVVANIAGQRQLLVVLEIAFLFQAFNFTEKYFRVKNNAVADETLDVIPQHA